MVMNMTEAAAIMKKVGGTDSDDDKHDEIRGFESGEGGEGAGNRGKAHVYNAWFIVLLKWVHSLFVFPEESNRIEKMADNILVNETLIDNRLSDVHTVCNIRLFSREERMKMKRAKSTFKHLHLRFLYGFANVFSGMRMLFSLSFLKHPRFPNADSGLRLVPKRPRIYLVELGDCSCRTSRLEAV